MNVLLLGSGGREHALAVALSKSPLLGRLLVAPGNAGIADVATCVPVNLESNAAVIDLCREHRIDFVVVGPEAPLVAGLGDALTAAGIRYFGPDRAAARLEGSKGFTKDLCREFNIPTGAYGRFSTARDAKAYLDRTPALPVVVKADGLAAGKGVVIATTRSEADRAVDACFSGTFGAAGAEVVIEAFLDGEEASFFVLCDGTHVLPLATAQDHKRVGDGDTGLNTGGMGAYSPAPVMTEAMVQRTLDDIIRPTIDGMRKRGTPFRGVLFAGLMITGDGPKLIEYNVRFGDPECQALLMRLKSDLLAALLATTDGTLPNVTLDWHADPALVVVMAAKGYPGTPETGTEIKGLAEAAQQQGVAVFHAGTRKQGNRILANGGRVLNVAARGATVAEAQRRAYAAVDKISWPGGFCRRDIGWRAIEREGQIAAPPALADLFPGFSARRIHTSGAEIFLRIGGSGPPLLLLHGYPQTHVCWHRVAPTLAKHFTVVAMDLRGYGWSAAPSGDPDHLVYSKRAMADDAREVMETLGVARFAVMGHDRGARVAYRLALDHPDLVTRLVALDIIPTGDVWARANAASLLKAYHWTFLAQPLPMPETLINARPEFYCDWTLASWTRDRTLAAFDPRALAHYRALVAQPERVHAICEDYRAGASYDRAADDADKIAGRKIHCPTLVLWGSDYIGKGSSLVLDTWQSWCTNVSGAEIVSGHFLAEENPESTLATVLPFLKGEGTTA